jgi:S1-C subfamily serine protease
LAEPAVRAALRRGSSATFGKTMKQVVHIVLFGLALIARAGEPPTPPTKLAPVTVNETPFGWLGIERVHFRPGLLAILNKSTKLKVLFIDSVVSDSPAHKAGILPKDEVLKIDGVSIRNISIKEMTQLLTEKEVGEVIAFEVRRRGLKEPLLFLKVKIERQFREKPTQTPEPTSGLRPAAAHL